MVQKRDVLPYLVALKSFSRQANPKRVIIVCDPSIDETDRRIFKRHVPHVELRLAKEFTNPHVPRGGTWERLMAIAEYSRQIYVVQLDADTVTTQPVPEVIEAIRTGHGFVLGESPQQTLVTATQSSEAARNAEWKAHIQASAELAMVETSLPAGPLYVRGCSGFTGFPVTTTMQEKLISYSLEMGKLLGSRWTEWGTEQVTSNYLVANATGTFVLPYPKYATPDVRSGATAFLHFIGSMRFISSAYESTSREIIRCLPR
jgi:hypothetical protein